MSVWDRVPLGKYPDEMIAGSLGAAVSVVERQRERRGIPACLRAPDVPSIDWDSLPLGDMTDRQAAEEVGATDRQAWRERTKRGIVAFKEQTLGTDWVRLPLGKLSDAEIADSAALSQTTVSRARRRFGIKSSKRPWFKLNTFDSMTPDRSTPMSLTDVAVLLGKRVESIG